MTHPDVKDLLDFRRKTVIVTGASRGIGAGIARRFAEAGAGVAVGYKSGAVEANAVVAEIAGRGGEAMAVQADVTCEDDVERLMARSEERFGGLDAVVNNAGIYPLAPLVEMTAAQWDAVIDANLKSVFLATRAAARRMIANGTSGAVINIGSIEAENPAPTHSHYNASKAGVVMHTRAAALELGPHGIRVNTVSPGLIGRPGLEEEWPDGVHRYTRAAPLRRLGDRVDIADACLFLASPAAGWITGVNLVVDGGVMTAQHY